MVINKVIGTIPVRRLEMNVSITFFPSGSLRGFNRKEIEHFREIMEKGPKAAEVCLV